MRSRMGVAYFYFAPLRCFGISARTKYFPRHSRTLCSGLDPHIDTLIRHRHLHSISLASGYPICSSARSGHSESTRLTRTALTDGRFRSWSSWFDQQSITAGNLPPSYLLPPRPPRQTDVSGMPLQMLRIIRSSLLPTSALRKHHQGQLSTALTSLAHHAKDNAFFYFAQSPPRHTMGP